jgi:hypothetical protein
MTTLFADSCARRPKEVVDLVMNLVGFVTFEHGHTMKYDPLDDAEEPFGVCHGKWSNACPTVRPAVWQHRTANQALDVRTGNGLMTSGWEPRLGSR